jgi:hypothetical protein
MRAGSRQNDPRTPTKGPLKSGTCEWIKARHPAMFIMERHENMKRHKNRLSINLGTAAKPKDGVEK